VGAFNMLRAEASREMGGHHALRMDVADDIHLGKRVKQAGYRQCLAESNGMIQVRWAVGLRGVIHVLTKNAFAGLRYSWAAVLVSGLGLLIANVWPFAGLFLGPPLAQWLCLAVIASMLATALSQASGSRISAWHFLTWPLAAVLFLYIIVRSGMLAERQRGIYWRGTFYPLEELRRNQV
jgi:VIT1/CCC1 family predicted Fe2+/Mn2+ transporter